MIDFLRLCRLYYVVPMALAYALTVYYARGGAMAGEWTGMLVSTLALTLVLSAAYVLNDVCDVGVDRINAPHRPVAAGRVARRSATAWSLVLLAGGLLTAAAARPAFLIGLTAVAAALEVYDLTSKRLGVIKQIAVAAFMASIYPLALAQAGGATGRRAWTLAIFPVWLFATSFGYELLKDIRDLAGDRAALPAPNPLQRSPGRWRRIANVAIVLGALLLVGPRLAGCGPVYMAVAVPAMAAAVLATLLPPRAALACIYLECMIVGLAATLDVIVYGW